MPKFLDPYTIFARYLPALLSAFPLFILWFHLSDNVQLKELVSFIQSVKFLSGITFSLVFLHFYSLIIREISKYFERYYFTGGKTQGFPTTYLMTYANSAFSDGYKDKYRQLILQRFDFKLLSKEEEKADPIEAKKRLNEAAGFVRQEIQEGYLVLWQNICFGSFRNLIGGTTISMPFCIIGILLGWYVVEDNEILFLFLGSLFFLYLVIFLFRKRILIHNGEAYAERLFLEFIGSNPSCY